MSKKPETDLAKALQLALLVNEIRQNAVISDLHYMRQVMQTLKSIPKLKPPATPIRLSEIAPTIPELPPEEEEEAEETRKPGVFKRIAEKIRRLKGE